MIVSEELDDVTMEKDTDVRRDFQFISVHSSVEAAVAHMVKHQHTHQMVAGSSPWSPDCTLTYRLNFQDNSTSRWIFVFLCDETLLRF